ncbi:MAG TPA: sensor histidine kinase [Verrucomicrobiae bacterium]|jgi:signal transduction histidine kinase|nr:sensor histidine kinase [Verrucomicrobiae bacterium]
MKHRITIRLSIILVLWGAWLAGVTCGFAQEINPVEVNGVEVNGKSLQWQRGSSINLGASPLAIQFRFGLASGTNDPRLRLNYKLAGYDSTWQMGGGYMFATVRFCNDAGDLVEQMQFKVRGESAGWNGGLESSPLTHRRETLTVPAGASNFQVVFTSAGPPSTLGIYVIDHLVVSKISSGKPKILLRSPFDEDADEEGINQATNAWLTDGTRPSMAKVVEIGSAPKTKAMAIIDEDPFGHAEWHNAKESAPRVMPNDNMVMEWNEMYSIGESRDHSSVYPTLPAGKFVFQVEEVTILGKPTGRKTELAVRVPRPFWESPWFWGAMAMMVVVVVALSVRYYTSRRMQRAMFLLEQQRALEEERMRIARDIHDDLGARVTQISMMSGMAQKDTTLSEKARAEFDQIYLVSRDLVSALYETVWAVDPENDNVNAMGDYLRQTINEMCTQAQLRCRIHVSPLPLEINVSSRIRHNFSMAAREAVHNIIKHARATLVTARITFADKLFDVSIQDDGCGFDQAGVPAGHGLKNMKRRLEGLGGNCAIESSPGQGTTIHFKLVIGSGDGKSGPNGSQDGSKGV